MFTGLLFYNCLYKHPCMSLWIGKSENGHFKTLNNISKMSFRKIGTIYRPTNEHLSIDYIEYLLSFNV